MLDVNFLEFGYAIAPRSGEVNAYVSGAIPIVSVFRIWVIHVTIGNYSIMFVPQKLDVILGGMSFSAWGAIVIALFGHF